MAKRSGNLCFLTWHAFALPLSLAALAAGQLAYGEPAAAPSTGWNVPTIDEMIDSRTDVWGEAARREPNGASYEFFKDRLPPLRWVNTEFRHYPIVLSAPQARHKARLVSNGSGINPRANKPPMWNEQGAPTSFFVGDSSEPFGEWPSGVDEPNYLDGHLPVVTTKYRHGGADYRQEVFAPVSKELADCGAAMVRFSVAGGPGRIETRVDADGPLRIEGREVLNEQRESLLAFSSGWKWNPDHQLLAAQLKEGQTAELVVFTQPAASGAAMSADVFDQRKDECVAAWKDVLQRSLRLETPEGIVNDAWRATLIGNFMIAVGDRLNYSAGNAYAKLYQGECGDTLRSMMLFGHLDAAPAMLKPLLEFNRKATQFHVAGHKLQLLAHFYWMTRDADAVRAYEPLWRPSVELILKSRESNTGLLPKDNYAGDINQQVYSLNSNANCWRGLRDVAAMLDDMDANEESEPLQKEAAAYREVILKAVSRSERRDAHPPFIPIALLSDEPAHDPLTATRTGSYYNLMSPYVIGSEVFGHGSDQEDWLLGYLENHGAIAMGMIRSMPHQGQFNGEPGVNPLYGLRYQLALLRRDEREKALTGFYGQLAQGMTRGTFIGGEGSRFQHGDANGRSFYLPPNSSSNAAWLITLRYLLIQDWDLDQDAKPDALRLLFATPRRWLMDGQQVRIEEAPTAFGNVSCRVESRLKSGYVEVRVTPPPRPVKTVLLRAPLPAGWQVESVSVDGKEAQLLNGDTVDLSGRTKPLSVRFAVIRS
ncbi:MAG: hypothetical protein H0T51_00510 [Pirellulales bacterium]|nr:hypothetical protein [Pirellulales bacterium]